MMMNDNQEGKGRSGIRLVLRRTISNRSCTMGVLSVEGTDIMMYTREDKRPVNAENYIKHCLRPGTYRINVEYGVVDIGNNTVRGFWPVFEKVPWFPRAGFCVASNYGCRLGRINIGTGMPDEFSLDGADEATAMMMRIFKDWKDAPVPVTLTIVEPQDMVLHDYTRDEFYARIQAEKERKEQQVLERQLFGEPVTLASKREVKS